MKKFYTLLLMVFAVAMGVSAQTYYNGKLDVEMVGEKIADGMDARVSLSESADGTYVFKLPDFRITINETELPCGDIVVEGVTRKDGKLSGSVNDLSLAMGQIHAKVDLVGTETAEGAMDLAITVGWYTDYPDDLSATMPINVTFKGQKYDSVVTEYPVNWTLKWWARRLSAVRMRKFISRQSTRAFICSNCLISASQSMKRSCHVATS